MSESRSELVAAVNRSPQAAAAHDRAGWVGLFTDDGRVEDPVGSKPHIGPLQIGRFYDTFIAPRTIVFEHDADIVCGSAVIRDVVLEVGMGPAVTMRIPAVLRYDMRPVAGEWKFERLRAYWELPAMVLQFIGNGLAAGPQSVALGRALLANQGLRGAVGFATGFRGPRLRGKKTVRAFLDAIAVGDELRARRALTSGATITRSDTALKFGAFRDELQHRRPTKILVAGSSVAVSMSGPSPAVVVAELDRSGRAISRLSYFTE
ncbi:ketosteroid isomerase family protein [Mycobacterium sp. NBC_00419]|uniref:ketosteroid isomerase family protein n=1 Tax=Mycobacterium sp. NBC_00419 TaxID=2975989 RepID=UPI002E1F137D